MNGVVGVVVSLKATHQKLPDASRQSAPTAHTPAYRLNAQPEVTNTPTNSMPKPQKPQTHM